MTAPLTKTLKVELPDYAEEFFYPHRYKVLYGGRGAARSWTVARILAIKAAQVPTRVLCTREIQSSLKDSVYQLLKEQIELLGIGGFSFLKDRILHENGSLFLFEGLRYNVTTLKSLEGIDICWVEEAERISKESWAILVPTIRKPGSEIWVTFNPDKEEDPTYQRFVVHQPPNTFVKQVGWEDNPWFDQTELPAEKNFDYSVDAEAAEHVWGGKTRTVTDAQIFRDKWVVEPFVVPTDPQTGEPLWHGPYQGMDFGFSQDPFAAVRCWVDDSNHILYIEYECFKVKLDIDFIPTALAGDISGTEGIPEFADYVARADSSRPDSISYLKRHELPRIEPAKKGPESVNDGIAHMRAYRKIVVHSRCVHTKDEFARYSYKVDPMTGDIHRKVVDKHNHCIDSIRYAIEPLILPQRKVGFIWADGGETRKVCPQCQSYLQDDGECPHCDYQENGNGDGELGVSEAVSVVSRLAGIND